MDLLKQLRVTYLVEGYINSCLSLTLFNRVGCGGGINRFKSRWEEQCSAISATHAHIYPNQRIFLRLKNQLFLSLFPRAILTYVWCRFGVNNILDYNEVVAVWSFSLAVLMKWIPYGTSNTFYGTHSLALYFQWLNCLRREILSPFILLLLSVMLYKCCLTEAQATLHHEMNSSFSWMIYRNFMLDW